MYEQNNYAVTESFELTISKMTLNNLVIDSATMLSSPYLKTTFSITGLTISNC